MRPYQYVFIDEAFHVYDSDFFLLFNSVAYTFIPYENTWHRISFIGGPYPLPPITRAMRPVPYYKKTNALFKNVYFLTMRRLCVVTTRYRKCNSIRHIVWFRRYMPWSTRVLVETCEFEFFLVLLYISQMLEQSTKHHRFCIPR